MTTLSKKILLLTLAFLITGAAFSQRKKIERANEQFRNYSFIDARKIYEEILKDNPKNGTAEIYKKLGDTYYLNGQYAQAADRYNTLMLLFPANMTPKYYFRLAQSLKSQGKYDEAAQVLEGVDISSIRTDVEFDSLTKNKTKRFIVDKVSVNTNASDFGTSFYQNKLVYASVSKLKEGDKIDDWTGQPFLDLYVADMDKDGRLSNSSAIAGDINTKYHESSATFTKDGTTIYFTRNNFIGGKKGTDQNKTIRLKLYKATRSGDNFWTNVKELPFPINGDEFSSAHPALSVDEKKLYFASDRIGSIVSDPQPYSNSDKNKNKKADTDTDLLMSDIWYIDILGNDMYSTPRPVQDINTGARETFPFISSNNELYFASDGPGGEGGLDIYKTKLDAKGKPGVIARFDKPVNSNQDDFGFIWDDKKEVGYFSSNRDGASGSVSDDIYRVVEQCIVTITGVVTDKNSGKLLPGAKVVLLDFSNNKQIGEPIIVGEDAFYSFEVDCSTQYLVRGTKTEYAPDEKEVKTPDETSTIKVPLELSPDNCCVRGDLGCCLCLQAIYFDFDRYNIRPDAAIELNKIYIAMKAYPQLIIHIESHTDSRGSNKYNEGLSDKRAQSTLNWLVEKGISPSRLSAKGYGETRLLDRCTYLDPCGQELQRAGCSLDQYERGTEKCSDRVQCSEEEHQTNRRSKFIIQN